MSEDDKIWQLVKETRNMYVRAASLVKDFDAALSGGSPAFEQHIKNYDIGAYGHRNKLNKPDSWLIECFAMPYRLMDTKFPKKLICMAMMFFDSKGAHNRAYIKLGILNIKRDKGWTEYSGTQGWYLYHPMYVGGRTEGDFQFTRLGNNEYLIKSTPSNEQVAKKYFSINKVTYFVVPILNIESQEKLVELCINPIKALWEASENNDDLSGWNGVKGMEPASNLPEITD